MQSPLPETLLASLSTDERIAVQAWWAGLPAPAQQELALSWDARAATCGFSLVDDGAGAQWQEMPIQIGARFLPADEQDDGEDWNVDFYEYLINNPELGIHFNGRTFHICTAHPAARVVLRVGAIPAAFKCPLAEVTCPMHRLLRKQPGMRVVLHGERSRDPVLPPEQPLHHVADTLDDARHADAE